MLIKKIEQNQDGEIEKSLCITCIWFFQFFFLISQNLANVSKQIISFNIYIYIYITIQLHHFNWTKIFLILLTYKSWHCFIFQFFMSDIRAGNFVVHICTTHLETILISWPFIDLFKRWKFMERIVYKILIFTVRTRFENRVYLINYYII